MKRSIVLCCALGLASILRAAETSQVDYGQITTPTVLSLVWQYETQTAGEVTYAVITGLRDEVSAYPSGDITVPTTVYDGANGYVVKALADGAFRNQIGITSISIPITVQTIGTGVFTGCSVLGAISVDSANPWFAASDGALYDKDRLTLIACPALSTSISIPASVTSIAAEAFAGCHRLTTITVPSDVVSVGPRAFMNCTHLKSVTFKGNAPAADDTIFLGTPDPIVYKQKLSTGWNAYPWTSFPVKDSESEQTSATTQTISGNVNWTYRVFGNSEAEIYNNGTNPAISAGTRETYTLVTTENGSYWSPDGTLNIPTELDGHPVTKIGKRAFAGCSALLGVSIPSSIKCIDDSAFEDCSSIEEITLPNALEELGYAPFSGTWISSLNLPAKLSVIDGNPFAGCTYIDTISVDAKSRRFVVANNILYNREKTKLYGVLPYHDSAFVDTITIPSSVLLLSVNPFSTCEFLTKVTFNCNAPTLEDNELFADTPSTLTIYTAAGTTGWDGTSTTNLPASGFWPEDAVNQRHIISLYDPGTGNTPTPDDDHYTDASGITWYYRVIEDYAEIYNNGKCAVASASAITTLTLPTTLGNYIVKSIGERAFANLKGITTVSVPTTYESISDFAFSNCTSLASVTIANGVRMIGKAPFVGTRLETLSIPASVETLNGNPGTGAASLRAFTVDANNLDFTASNGLLYDKTLETLLACPAGLAAITLPKTTRAIAADAFASCRRLSDVTALCNEPLADETIFTDTPLTLTTSADACSLLWTNPSAATWKNRPFQNTSTGNVSSMTDASGVEWTYTVNGTTVSLGAYGETPVIPILTEGEITVPDTLGSRPVTEIPELAFANCGEVTKIILPASIRRIAANAFNGCTSLVEFAVSPANPNFSSRNRCLYSKDGKTLIRVPAAMLFSASQTQTTAEQRLNLTEVGGVTTSSKQVSIKTIKTVAYVFTPTVTAEKILSGVSTIADNAFTDCGLIPKGTLASGTLVARENGKELYTRRGAFYLPFSTEKVTGTATTNEISATAGFRSGTPTLSRTVAVVATTYVTDVPLVIPASVTTIAANAFDDAHFTSITRQQPQILTGLLTLQRFGGTSEVYGPLTPGVSVSLDLSEFTGYTTGTLPAGLKWTKTTGLLSGIPTKPGTFTVTFKKTVRENNKNTTVSQAITVRVADYPTMSVAAWRANPLTDTNEPIAAGQKLSFYVGVAQNFVLPISDDLPGVLNTLTVKGLPSGLKLVKTAVKNEKRTVTNYIYSIAGTPTKAQESRPLTITVSNKYKWSGALSMEIEILTLPAWVSGSYNGVRYDMSSNAYGVASATLSTAGKLSGKFLVPSDDLTSGKSYSFSAASLSAYDSDTDTFLGTATMKIGRESFALPFSLAKDEDGTGRLLLETPDGSADLVQNIWNRRDLVAPAYTKGTKITIDGITFRFSAKGVVTWSGKIEDDAGKLISVSGTSQLLNGMDLLLYVPAKRNLLGGICQLVILN